MRLTSILAIVVLSFGCLGTTRGAIINFSSTGNVWEDSTGTGLVDGNIVSVGIFAGGFNFGDIGTVPLDTFAEVNAFFTEIGADVTSSALGSVIPANSGAQEGGSGTSGSTSSPIYFWTFNSSDRSTATEWAIVSNTLWTVPADPVPGNISIDLGVDVGTRTIEFGSASSTNGLGGGPNVQTAAFGSTAIPEPISLITMAIGLGCLLLLTRHRRNTAQYK